MAFCALAFLEELLASYEVLRSAFHFGIDPAPIHLVQSGEILSNRGDLMFREMESGHACVHPPSRLYGARILQERAEEFRLRFLALGVQIRRPLEVVLE